MKTPEFLEKHHVPFHLLPHKETYGAQRLAETLHVPGQNVAKTVLLRADRGCQYLVAVLPATKTIDLKQALLTIGGNVLELATEIEMADHCPESEIGLLPPFGSQYGMQTIVDQSLTKDDDIVFEGNTHHEAIRMKFADFRRLEKPLIARFAR